jgi:hypothetical protein
MSEFSNKCSNSVLAGVMAAAPVFGNVGLYCSLDELCRPEVADLSHVHQQERNQWDPAPRYSIAVQSSTSSMSPIFRWYV